MNLPESLSGLFSHVTTQGESASSASPFNQLFHKKAGACQQAAIKALQSYGDTYGARGVSTHLGQGEHGTMSLILERRL